MPTVASLYSYELFFIAFEAFNLITGSFWIEVGTAVV